MSQSESGSQIFSAYLFVSENMVEIQAWADCKFQGKNHIKALAASHPIYGQNYHKNCKCIVLSLQVEGHKMGIVRNCQLCLSFYLYTNISDENIRFAPQFICVEIFQIHFQGTKWTFPNHSSSKKMGKLNFCKSFRYLT